MPFPSYVKEDTLVASGRHCCPCHRFCGTKIEVHHIRLENEGGENILENAIPLCFNCHADMTSYDAKHPKDTRRPFLTTRLARECLRRAWKELNRSHPFDLLALFM